MVRRLRKHWKYVDIRVDTISRNKHASTYDGLDRFDLFCPLLGPCLSAPQRSLRTAGLLRDFARLPDCSETIDNSRTRGSYYATMHLNILHVATSRISLPPAGDREARTTDTRFAGTRCIRNGTRCTSPLRSNLLYARSADLSSHSLASPRPHGRSYNG